ncbi:MULTISPECIES: sigma factor [Bacillaceae]|uniref:sigma factor n=1 Tax=Bacillaceae TaxID=186817 RepID=UPI001CEF64EB|nr:MULTISPECIES: sigma factor [Bacillaceae]
MRGGNEADSIDSLYSTYFSDIYRFLFSLCHNHHTAEDLVQETFFRAYLLRIIKVEV